MLVLIQGYEQIDHVYFSVASNIKYDYQVCDLHMKSGPSET